MQPNIRPTISQIRPPQLHSVSASVHLNRGSGVWEGLGIEAAVYTGRATPIGIEAVMQLKDQAMWGLKDEPNDL